MRILLIASVITEYRIPALRALGRLPDVSLHVLTTTGGPWASAQGVTELSSQDFEAEFVPAAVTSLGGVKLVRFPGLRDAVRRIAPDVIIAEPRMGLLSVVGLALAPAHIGQHRIPLLWWMAGWRNTGRPRVVVAISDAMTAVVIRRASAVAAYSSRAAQRAVSLGVPSSAVVVAQNAVDTAEIELLTAASERHAFDGGLRMLFIGQVLERKRLDLVLAAMASGRPGTERALLRIVGSGAFLQELQVLAGRLGVGDRVICLPATFVPRELAEHLMWADVGVLPHAGGLMLNTCMAAGLPVAAGRADGTELDLISDDECGWIVDETVSAWAEWIERCVDEGSQLIKVGRAASDRLRTKASLDNMVARLVEACGIATEGRRS